MSPLISKHFDLIAIGDLATDAFIHLADDAAKQSKSSRQLCLNFGDKIPYQSLTIVPAVGNSGNAAVTAARLGLKVALVSNLGQDAVGTDSITTLKQEKVATKFITRHRELSSNYHYVLWYGDDRTILIKHEKYQYQLPDFAPPQWLYLSSLSENSLDFHLQIADYLKKHPTVKLAFQPGTFQIKLSPAELAPLYCRTEIIICNKEEAQKILRVKNKDVKKLLTKLRDLGPKIAIITDGERGAYAEDIDGKKYFIPIYPDLRPPLERTGAGDAFSATIVSALLLGLPLTEALLWGPVNSMAVIQQIGAQRGLLSKKVLTELLTTAPKSYKLKKI